MFEEEIYDTIENKLFYKAMLKKVPLKGYFELTPRCSLSCKMCYVVMTPEQIRQSGRRELTASEWLNLAEQGKQNGMLFALLTGGEAMIRPDFKEIYTGMQNMGLSVDLNSNGTLFTDDMLAFFEKNPPSQINLTLYGATNESYERLCGIKNGFDRVSAALDALLSMGINVKVQATLTPYNYQDLDALTQYVNDRRVYAQFTSYNFPPRRRPGVTQIERLPAAEAAEIQAKIKTSLWCTPGKNAFIKNYDEYAEKVRSGKSEMLHMKCRAGQSAFWITWDGVMTPCATLDCIREYPLEIGVKAAWERINARTVQITYPEKCRKCEKKVACPGCPAVYLCETGDMNNTGDYLCEFAGTYLESFKMK